MMNYLGKIAYHLACGNEDKAQYFFERQVKMFGPITADDMMVIINRRDKIVENS
tara:strand:+ start:786 stop:947 length:162 start_codon:yes stop_codon:yes gene_type:complete